MPYPNLFSSMKLGHVEIPNRTAMAPINNGLLSTDETWPLRTIRYYEERAIGVEVLNGTNVTGLASRTAQLFQSYGFDVVSVGNADNSQHGETVVLDRKSRLDLAERVADIIRCRRYHTSMDPNLDVAIDVTVILGKDFDGRYCEE